MKEIQSVAIVGMGALGIMYGAHIQKHTSCTLQFVMDAKRLQVCQTSVFTCNKQIQHFSMLSCEDAKPVDLVIVAVKYTGLHAALNILKNLVREDTTIISVLNGISSEEIIGQVYGMEKIVYTVAQGMDAMKFGTDLTYTQMGELHIGQTKDCDPERLQRLCRFFDTIEMPYVLEQDILYRMWGKFMLNVGINQTCMVYQADYQTALSKGPANRTLIASMREVIALVNAEGIPLSEKDLNFYIDILKTLSPTGTPSMGQDRINKRPSEVDMFAGTVIQLAKKHGLHVPENEYIYEKVKEIEQTY